MLAERFSQDPLEMYFCKQHPPAAWKDTLHLHGFSYTNTFQNQISFKHIATGSVRDENKKFESHRCRKKYKQNNPCNLQKFQAAIRYLAIKPTQQLNYINT